MHEKDAKGHFAFNIRATMESYKIFHNILSKVSIRDTHRNENALRRLLYSETKSICDAVGLVCSFGELAWPLYFSKQ